MPLALLSTKLHAPAPAANLVVRPRLLERLKDGLLAKLILVSAPAGAGKSTLLANWLGQLARPTAWLSLDKSDDDLERFLFYLVSALQQTEPDIGAGLQDVLQTQSSVLAEPLIIRLINDISHLDHELLLVLDDYHVLSDQRIHDAVAFLLDHLPSQLCLVIATRRDPPLALPRWRVQGRMVEIRADDLRFSMGETHTLLNDQLGLELSSSAIARLDDRTEGWIAGLQLAALSLHGRKDKEAFITAFAGSHHHLVDYLVAEVLTKQTPEVRRFLQQTSILERFTASLCESVSGQPQSAEMLEQLLSANLFIVPLDDEGTWYRYHHLFAEFLQNELRRRESEWMPELHLRASAWLEQEGWLEEAIQHALKANDSGRAARLVEGVVFELSIYWNNAQLIKYVQKLPAALLSFHPRLCVFYTIALTNTGQLGTLATALPLLEKSRVHAQQPQTVAACVVYLRAYECLRQLDFAGTTKLCQKALELLGPPGELPSNEEHWLRAVATTLMAYTYLHSDPAQANQLYPTIISLCQTFGIFVGITNSFARLGRVKHQLGQLYAAKDVYKQGFSFLEHMRSQDDWSPRAVNAGELHLNMSRLLYEWNRLDEAADHLRQVQEFTKLSQFPPVGGLELATSLQLALARGDVRSAQILLNQLDHLDLAAHPDNLFHKQLLDVMVMKGWLALEAHTPGLEPALAELVSWVGARNLRVEDSFDYPHEAHYEILARLLLAQDKPHAVLPLLERLRQAAHEGGRADDLLRYLLLQVLAAQRLGQEERALQTLRQALDLAEPEGYCRTFVDMGPALQALLTHLADSRSTPYLVKLLTAFPDRVERVAESTVELAAIPASLAPVFDSDGPLLLNDRERTVLRLLAAGNSHKQIAKTIQLSPNTVRWYMQSLYAKLQVSNRTQAVNRARDVGLL